MSVRKIAVTLSVSCVALASSGAFAHIINGDAPKFLRAADSAKRVQSAFDINDSRVRNFTVFLTSSSAASVSAVQKYFESYGFKTAYDPHTNTLHLEGTYAQAQASGHFNYQMIQLAGTSFPRPSQKPSFGAVQDLVARATFSIGPKLRPLSHVAKPQDTDLTVPIIGYGPPDYAAIYDIPLTGTAPTYDGTGTTVDIAGCGTIDVKDGQFTDVEYFKSLYPGYFTKDANITVIPVDASDGSEYIGIEPVLDVERVYGTAQGTAIRLFTVPLCTSNEWIDMITAIQGDQATNPAVALTISYGLNEGVINYYPDATSYFADASAGYAAILATGTTIFASSGDSGSFAYYPWSPNIHVDVSYPASDPSILGVGGTTVLPVIGGTGYTETAWSGGGFSGTGGGVSSVFTAPKWQRQALGLTKADPKQVPDLSNNADPFTGATLAYSEYFCYYSYYYYQYVCGTYQGAFAVGGTSASSPTTAGILALLDQKAGATIPNVGALIYASAKTGFNDITVGANGAFKTKKGYDNVTGVGTPDVGKLLASIP
jgi:subtilase family serine protease